MKKRFSNIKPKKLPEPKLVDSDERASQSKDDVVKHEKELQKELGKKVINWKAAEQLLNLTFAERRDKISTITRLHAVSNMLDQFPYFEHEKVVSISIVLRLQTHHQTCSLLREAFIEILTEFIQVLESVRILPWYLFIFSRTGN